MPCPHSSRTLQIALLVSISHISSSSSHTQHHIFRSSSDHTPTYHHLSSSANHLPSIVALSGSHRSRPLSPLSARPYHLSRAPLKHIPLSSLSSRLIAPSPSLLCIYPIAPHSPPLSSSSLTHAVPALFSHTPYRPPHQHLSHLILITASATPQLPIII